MKDTESKATSDAFECRSEMYLSLRNSIHSSGKQGEDHITFCCPFSGCH